MKERERFWISYFNSYKNGYNQTPGGDATDHPLFGEQHANAKLTEQDVVDIRLRWYNKESVRDIYKSYENKIQKTGFHKIIMWETWKYILPELNTSELKEYHRCYDSVLMPIREVKMVVHY